MRTVLSALLVLLLANAVQAATVSVSWTNPTQNEDATTIPASGEGSLREARIEHGTCVGGAFGVKNGEVKRPMPVTSAVLNLPFGQHCIRAHVSTGYTINAVLTLIESDPSNVLAHLVQPSKPGAPGNLRVTVPTAFDVRADFEKFAFIKGREVGAAQLGAACDERRTVGEELYALEQPTQVDLKRMPRSTAVVAKCGS